MSGKTFQAVGMVHSFAHGFICLAGDIMEKIQLY